MKQKIDKKIGFFVFKDIHIPHHLREYYASKELEKSGWGVVWLLPNSGTTSNDLTIQWPILRYRDCDFRGRKYIFPVYFACLLKIKGIDTLWISGWAQRDPDALNKFVTILKRFGIRIIYDTVDPIEMFQKANNLDVNIINFTLRMMKNVYKNCDLIFSVTPQIKQEIILAGGADEKVFSCRWGTDTSVFNPQNVNKNFRREIGIDENVFLIGWLGSTGPLKGLDEIVLPLIEKCSLIFKNIHFIIAGNESLEKKVSNWLMKRPDLPVTLFARKLSYRNTAEDFTGNLDAYLVPVNPMTEFGRKICPIRVIDGLAMGVDVITTKTEATEFLSNQTPLVHLCEFTIESFQDSMQKIIRMSSRKKSETLIFDAISHQSVSKKISSIIDSHLCS